MFLLILTMTLCAEGEGVPSPDTPPEPLYSREEWQPAIRQVLDQLNLLDLFATATRFGGVRVKVPKELQALPVRMIEGAEELRDKGVDIYVKELEFRDVQFFYGEAPQWRAGRPLIPTRIEFGKLGIEAEAKTRMGNIPVGAVFENGRMPAEFLPLMKKGFDLLLLPKDRTEETQLNDVRLKVGGPLVTGIANRFFSKKVARLILEHGMGQTLKLGQGDLLGSGADSLEGHTTGSLIERLLR